MSEKNTLLSFLDTQSKHVPESPLPEIQKEPPMLGDAVLREIEDAVGKHENIISNIGGQIDSTASRKPGWENDERGILIPGTSRTRGEIMRERGNLKEGSIQEEQAVDNLTRFKNYIQHTEEIEGRKSQLQEEVNSAKDEAEKKSAKARLGRYVNENIPLELRQKGLRSPEIDEKWITYAESVRQEAINEIVDTSISGGTRKEVAELKTRNTELEVRANAAEAAQKEAENKLAQLREEQFEQLQRAANEKAELQRQLDEANEKVATIPPIELTPAMAEPELQMDDAVLEEVETRNPLERIRDGVWNGVKAWAKNLDPRDKDLAWRIGAITGVTESTLTSIATVPGGRIAVSAINFLAAQGIYAGVKVAEKVAISRLANEGPVENDRVQAILAAREKYQNADHKIRNFFMGLSAGMTAGAVTSALIHGAYSLGENLLGGHEAVTPTVVEAPGVIKKFVVKPFGWTPGAEGAVVFNPVVTIPDHGNFWTAWHIDSSSAANWTDLHNGTTHTDVIKDMVVKLARANGHELGIVHAGDQIDLGKVLTFDQLELVKKAAKAKSYQEYLSGIRPGYLSFLKK